MFLESQFVCAKIELRKMVNSENVPRLGTSAARILFKVSRYCVFRRIQSLLLPVPWYSPLVSVIMPSLRSGVKNIALWWHAALRRHVCFQVVTSRYTVRFQGMRKV